MNSVKYILLALLALVLNSMDAQTDTLYIQKDSVYYEFDIRLIDSLMKGEKSLISSFEELELEKLIEYRIHEFRGWQITQHSEFQYRFKKALDDFTDEYKAISKYFVDNYYWKRPLSEVPDGGEFRSVYQEIAKENPKGNKVFFLAGMPNAEKVYLAGSFNNWDPSDLLMKKVDDGWEITMELSPGIYEYKFVVDSAWMEDPGNNLKLENIHATYNSILLIGKKHDFLLKGFEDADSVYLAGSFNNWDPKSIPMAKTEQGWKASIEIPPGKHFYKFIVDNLWMTDPENDLTQKEFNNINSVLIIN